MSDATEITGNPLDSLVQAKSLTEFRSGLEVLAAQDIPLLTEMAELSLVLTKKEHTEEAKSKAGAIFLKKALEMALETRAESTQKVVKYFGDASSYFAFIVAAPFVIASENYDNIYLRHYIDINAACKNPHEVVSEKRWQDYAEFEEKVRKETEANMRGLLGEFMVFCSCQKAGLNPEAAFFKEDIKGTDMFIYLKKTKIPLQVKSRKPIYGLEAQELSSKVLINPNIPRFYRNDGRVNIEGLRTMLTDPKATTDLLHEIGFALKDWTETHAIKIEIPPALMIESSPKPAYA